MSKILLTGATGYVGGTVLSQLIASTEPSIRNLTFDLLVRSEAQAEKLRDTYGSRVNTIVWKGLHDVPFIEEISSSYDIIINAGSGFVPEGAVAFVKGLARGKQTGKSEPWMLHISGCTNLADLPLTQTPAPKREWNDEADGSQILDYIEKLDEKDPYAQRTTEIQVLKTAEQLGVQAISVNVPIIFGEGTGLFNKQGLVIPLIMMYVVQHGYGWKINETANFEWVHILDLADLYVLLVRTILEREDHGVGYLPTGKDGVMFSAVRRVLIKDINQGCLDAAFADGILPWENTPKEKEIRQVELQEIADKLTLGRLDVAERGWAGHKSTKAVLAPKLLGWQPKRLEEAWKQEFRNELVALKEDRRMMTLDSCIGTTQS